MAKKIISTRPGQGLNVTTIVGADPDGLKLAKTMFELSRDTDVTGKFDPAIHTCATIAAGIAGHLAMDCREVDEADLPTERGDRGRSDTFRDAWEDTGTAIQVNMTKAQVIHLDRIRGYRNAELVKLDAEFLLALESGNATEQARVTTLKQKLRDIPQTFDLTRASTPEALKALWPTDLPARS